MENIGDPLAEFGPAQKPLARARKRLVNLEKKVTKRRSKVDRTVQTVAAREAKAARRPSEVICLAPHWINGVCYGPGRVTVPEDLAAVIRENERRLQENNAAFEGKKAAFIGPKNRAQYVPYEFFDSPYINVLENVIIQ
jgi:hypothetical protein